MARAIPILVVVRTPLHPPSVASEPLCVPLRLPLVPTAAITLAALALALSVVAIVLATIANRRWAARSRSGDAARDSQPDRVAVAALATRLEALAGTVSELGGRVEGVRAAAEQAAAAAESAAVAAQAPAHDPTALRHVALVRYDAFADVGGRLSYSVALLDDTRSGLVLTTLAGKSDVRTYVRTISAGAAEGTLTAEEQQAIEAAGRDA